jgi:hypothetical protein
MKYSIQKRINNYNKIHGFISLIDNKYIISLSKNTPLRNLINLTNNNISTNPNLRFHYRELPVLPNEYFIVEEIE